MNGEYNNSFHEIDTRAPMSEGSKQLPFSAQRIIEARSVAETNEEERTLSLKTHHAS